VNTVPRSSDLRERVEDAEEVAEILAACWEGFEFIQQVADRYAMPGTPRYHPFMFAMTAACLGRDAVGFAPSMPAISAPAAIRPEPDETAPDDAAGEISTLASAIHGKLTATAACCPDTPADRRAFLTAAESAAEIRDLLSGP
jgi:hypothetical protein